MVTNTKYDKSKIAWDICEQAFAKHIVEDLWWEILETAPDRRFKDWDIKALIGWVVVTYEIKSDRKSEHSHNSLIEYEYKPRWWDWEPSWIAGTKADYFITYSDKKRRQQSVEELRKRLDARKKFSVFSWNGNRAKWWLFKCSEMPSLFDQIEEMEELPPFEDEEIEQKECVGG